MILPDVLKTWWPAPTWRRSLLHAFYHLQTRQRCLKTDWNSECLSYVPSLKIHTYLVIRNFKFGSQPLVLMISASSSLYFLGVIPKAVMDSMEFLMNFHLPKDTRKGHKRRHSFKGKTKYTRSQKNVLQNIPILAFSFLFLFDIHLIDILLNFTFSTCIRISVGKDGVLDSGEVKGQAYSLCRWTWVCFRRKKNPQEKSWPGHFPQCAHV